MRTIRSYLLLCLTILISGCGGGSSTSSSTPPPSSGGATSTPPTSMLIIGTITGFGSIYIGEVKYEIDNNTVVSIEGQTDVTGDDSNLAVGMKVRVRATEQDNVRIATTIEFDEDLKGIIEAITPDSANSTTGQILVLGQTVIIDDNTIFDNDVGNNDTDPTIDFRDLQLGMTVEISGYALEGGFLASRIDRLIDVNGLDKPLGDPDTDDDELELKGTVEAVASDYSSITVNGVEFLVTANTLLDNGLIVDNSLVGSYVEVSADLINNDYVARKIELEDLFDDNDRESEFEIEGILQAIDSSSTPETITINGIVIPVDSTAALAEFIGHKIEVKGHINDAGVVVISGFEQEQEQSLKTEDMVTNINTTSGTLTTRLGFTITPDGSSRLEDDASDNSDHLTPDLFLSNLMTGDLIKAGAIKNNDDSYTWVRVKRTELAGEVDDASCELTGEVTQFNGDVNDFSMIIGGITIQTSQVENHDFKDANEVVLGRSTFFNQLTTGVVVKAESFEGDTHCQNGLLEAEKVEFDEPDDD